MLIALLLSCVDASDSDVLVDTDGVPLACVVLKTDAGGAQFVIDGVVDQFRPNAFGSICFPADDELTIEVLPAP